MSTSPTSPGSNPAQFLMLNWQDTFLEHYEKTFNIAYSAKMAGVSRPTVYKYLERDPDFKERFDNARESAIDTLEGSAYNRATYGVPTIKKTYDLKTGTVTSETTSVQFSDSITLKMMEANRPEVYRTKTAIEHSGSIGVLPESAQDQFRELATQAIQNYISAGYTLELAIQTALGLGLPQDYIALVRPEDLKMLESGPVIDITPTNGDRSNGKHD